MRCGLKKLASLLLIFAMILPMQPICTKADEVNVAAVLQNGAERFASEEVDSQKTIESISGVIEHLSDPKGLLAWGAAKLFEELFKDDPMPGQKSEAEQLSELLSKMEAALGQLDAISKEIASTTMVQEINDFKLLDTADSDTKDYIRLLNQIDGEDKSAKEKEAARKKILLYTMTGAAEGSAINDNANGTYDAKYEKYSAFARTKFLTVDNDELYMIQMYDRLLRINVKWYNNYYKSKIGFQNYFIGKFMTVAMLEKMSLLARAQQYEADHPNTKALMLRAKMDNIDEEVATVQKIFDANKAFEPDSAKRYYMYPGNEMELWAQAKEQIIPSEPKTNVGLRVMANWVENGKKGEAPLKGITMKNTLSLPTYPNLEFWRGFISYEQDCLCPTSDWLKKVYQNYGSSVSLYDIFFGVSNGNFAVPADADSSWLFVVDPDNSLPMKYVKMSTEADHMTTPAVTSGGEQNYYSIYDYHYDYNNPGSDHRYIGLGVIGKPEIDIIDDDDDDYTVSEDYGGNGESESNANESELPSHSILVSGGVSGVMDMKALELDNVTVSNQEFLAGYYAKLVGKKAKVLCSYGIYYRNNLNFGEAKTKRTLIWNNLPYRTPGPIYAVCYNQTDGAYLMTGVVDARGTATFNDYIANEATNMTIFALE